MSFLIGLISLFVSLYVPQWLGWRWTYLTGARNKAAVAFGLMLIVSGYGHFATPAAFTAMMPPFLPEPLLLVYASGAAEILLGGGLLWPRTRAMAGLGTTILLVAVFPANIYAAQNGIISPGAPDSAVYLWLRLPLQLLFVAWVWWSSIGHIGDLRRRPGHVAR